MTATYWVLSAPVAAQLRRCLLALGSDTHNTRGGAVSTEDSRTAEGMRRDIVRHGAATWAVAMARPLADPPTEADKRGRLDVVVYAYGLERALAELHDVDPQLADRLAADLAADWEDGAAVGEWLWEHGVEIGVVVEGGVVGRDGVVRDSDRLCAEDAER